MNSKILISAGIICIFVLLFGAYYLMTKGATNQPATKILSYSSTDQDRPKAVVKTTFADLGNIKVSDEREASFTIDNKGKKTLQLFNISSSCGCTVGKVIINGKESEEFNMHSQSDYVGQVEPGKQAIVKVIYRPYIMPVYGSVEREVYLTTNDPDSLKLVFKVKVYVK